MKRSDLIDCWESKDIAGDPVWYSELLAALEKVCDTLSGSLWEAIRTSPTLLTRAPVTERTPEVHV